MKMIKFTRCLLLIFFLSLLLKNPAFAARSQPPTYCDPGGYDYIKDRGLCCQKSQPDLPIDINNPNDVELYCDSAPTTPSCPLGYPHLFNGQCYDTPPTKDNECDQDHQLVGGNKCCAYTDTGAIDYNDCINLTDSCPNGYHKEAGTCVINALKVNQDLNAITLSPKPCDYNGSKGIQTALGCIPYEPVSLIGWVLRWAIGVGGGIAFLLMAFASYQLMTSAGNPERLKAGQEMFVSAGAGLLFIIFSVFLLQLIGADILQIPGFNP